MSLETNPTKISQKYTEIMPVLEQIKRSWGLNLSQQ